MRFLGAFILFSAASFAAEYTIDSAHSSAVFSVRHMMVSNVRGDFQKLSGKVSGDLSRPETLKIEAEIDDPNRTVWYYAGNEYGWPCGTHSGETPGLLLGPGQIFVHGHPRFRQCDHRGDPTRSPPPPECARTA